MTSCEAVARTNPKWTPDLVKTLTELHEQGYSATLKARKINEIHGTAFSRNSIIGATHRANLPKRASTRKTGAHDPLRTGLKRDLRRADKVFKRPRRVTDRPQAYNPIPQIVDLEIPQEQRRTLLELTAHTCRWPVGDVDKPDFFFCGAEPMNDKPYCAAHHHRAVRHDR